jgi:hypothetical protein
MKIIKPSALLPSEGKVTRSNRVECATLGVLPRSHARGGTPFPRFVQTQQ